MLKREIGKMRVFWSASTIFATDCLMAVSKRSLISKRSRHVKRLKEKTKKEKIIFNHIRIKNRLENIRKLVLVFVTRR